MKGPGRSGRRLLRASVAWAFCSAIVRSRRPDRALRKILPGLTVSVTVVPIAAISLWISEFPLHALAAEATFAASMIARGALRQLSGRTAIAVAGAAWLGLITSHRDTVRTHAVLDDALRAELGADYWEGLPARHYVETPASLRKKWFPRFTERKNYLRHENLSYGEAGVRNHLDIWYRADLPANGRAPVILQIPGSAWVKGGKRGQAYPLLAHMAERGWVCVAINYSLAPKARWPAHIIDTKRAIVWVKREIACYGGDPDFIILTGGSAGGHLTALAALSPSAPTFQPGFEDADTSVVGAVPFYGVYDLLDRNGDSPPEQEAFLRRIVIGASAQDAYDVWDQGSALSWVNADAPPFFVLHGDIDTFTNPEQARAFVDSLKAVSRNPVVYAQLPGAQHMFDALPTIRTAAVVAAVDRFLTYLHHRRSTTASP
jgi:acetyl esterase/lipase